MYTNAVLYQERQVDIRNINIFQSLVLSSAAAAAVLSKKLTFVGQNCYSDKNREQSSFPLSYNQQWCILYDIFFSKSEPHYFMPPAGHAPWMFLKQDK